MEPVTETYARSDVVDKWPQEEPTEKLIAACTDSRWIFLDNYLAKFSLAT